MKLSIFKWTIVFLFLAGTLQAQEEIEEDARYKKRVEKYISRWEKLIPRYTKFQFAGSMGMLSLGTGWELLSQSLGNRCIFGNSSPQLGPSCCGRPYAQTELLPLEYPNWRQVFFRASCLRCLYQYPFRPGLLGQAARQISARLLLVLHPHPFPCFHRRAIHIEVRYKKELA